MAGRDSLLVPGGYPNEPIEGYEQQGVVIESHRNGNCQRDAQQRDLTAQLDGFAVTGSILS